MFELITKHPEEEKVGAQYTFSGPEPVMCLGYTLCVLLCVHVRCVCVTKALAPLFMLCCVWVSRALD